MAQKQQLHDLIKGFRTASRYKANGNSDRALQLLEVAVVRFMSEELKLSKDLVAKFMMADDKLISDTLNTLQ